MQFYQKSTCGSEFVWALDTPPQRNQFVSFIQSFEWVSPEPLLFHLFADTRYRLWVNEVFVAYGPGRFVTQFPEYDTYDLQSWLKPGENLVRVEVNFYGASSYQSMPDGMPGFWAAGGVPGICDLGTPGNWRAILHEAWDSHSPLFSFAQNPSEILDSRKLALELAQARTTGVEVLTGAQRPWGPPRPRSVPYPDYQGVHPKKLLLASASKDRRHLLAVSLRDETALILRSRGVKIQTKRQQITSWFFSENGGDVLLESFWSETELNGEPLALQNSHLGNHGFFPARLRKGWNFYSSNAPFLGECWSHLLAWPEDAGLSAHALPDRSIAAPWALSPVLSAEKPFPMPDNPESYSLPEGWVMDSGDPLRATPARLIAWDQPASPAPTPLPYEQLSRMGRIHATTAVWSLDFEDEFYGQPVLEVEAPAGTILDVAFDDWKRPDGCVNLYYSNPFTDAADRIILRGGRQTVELLNPRGGIYLQVVLRAPDLSLPADLTLHGVTIRSRQTLNVNPPPASFHSGDDLLDWIWNISTHTLRASTDEGYADCPWRERGSYIGDSLVNFHLHHLIHSDLGIARRTFRIMGEGQHLDGPRKGQLASVTPAWHRMGHDDFTLIWILCLRDYWAHTGDASLLEESWQRLQNIWESPVWKENAKGLWDISTDQHPFIDWGVELKDRYGSSNLIMNAFRLGALQASAQIAEVLKHPAEQHHFETESERVRSAMERVLWRPSEGRFAASESHNSPCLHGQVLALAFGIGDADLLLKTIEPELRNNFRQGMEKGQNSGHLELYFQIYLLPALARLGHHDLAMDFVREHFSYMKTLGYPTLNECFCRAARGVGSCCHSWSGTAAFYLQEHLGGLRQSTPGNPDEWILDPQISDWPAAAIELPHARGSIRVRWERKNGKILADISAPPGVSVRVNDAC